MPSGKISNPRPVIIEEGNWGAVGSIAAGETATVTKDLPTKTGYKTYLLDIHASAAAVGSWSFVIYGYTVSNGTVTIGITNN